jgi:hypothetical protein
MPATVANRQGQRYRSAFVAVAIALLGMGIAGSASSADRGAATDRPTTASPIKHVIVVIGENQSFDHLYGTHVPPSGDSISNLLVKGIVRPDGSPGPHFAKAKQFTTSGQTSYFISVATKNKTRYTTLPAPTLNNRVPNRFVISIFWPSIIKNAITYTKSIGIVDNAVDQMVQGRELSSICPSRDELDSHSESPCLLGRIRDLRSDLELRPRIPDFAP